MEKKVYYIVNPHSSNGRTGRIWPSFRRILEKRAGPIRFDYTRGILHAAELASRALQDGFDTVMAVGGDGTVNEALNGFFGGERFLRPDATLGYLSSGTGGDLSRTLSYHDFSLDRQADLLLEGRVRRLDYGEVSFRGPEDGIRTRRFINASSVGFSGNVLHAMNRLSKMFSGKIAYQLGVLRCLINLVNHTVMVTVDGREIYQGPSLLAVVANGRFFGGGMMIAPQARIDDGILDVIVVRAMTRRSVIRKIGTIYRGTHLALPEVIYAQGREVRISSPERVLLEMDGEQPGILDATFRIVRQGIPFLWF